MTEEQPPARRRFLVPLIAVGIVGLGLIAIGVYGLIAGPHAGRSTPEPTVTVSTAPAPSNTATPGEPQTLPRLPHTTDAVRYARAVAEALFTWETVGGHSRDEYLGVLLADADPTGYESPGLSSDLDSYLPSAQVWRELAGYETSQHLEDVTAEVPDSWAGIVAESGDQLRPGTVAVTIDATRVRDGQWLDQPAHSEHPVSFTIFVACEPSFDRCYTLRLSSLGNPLR